jgi:hypothetical protein
MSDPGPRITVAQFSSDNDNGTIMHTYMTPDEVDAFAISIIRDSALVRYQLSIKNGRA